MEKEMKNKDVTNAFVNDYEEYTKNLYTEYESSLVLVIYSYGHHFPLAIKMLDGHIVMNELGYSNTTQRHKGDLCRSLGFDNFKDFLDTHNSKDYSIMTTIKMKNLLYEKIKYFEEIVEKQI